MKAITLKDFMPDDPEVKQLLKRIALIAGVHLALGALAGVFGTSYPVFVLIGLLLCSALLGLLHWLSVIESNDFEALFEHLTLAALLTIICVLSLLASLLVTVPELSLLALAGLSFGVANIIGGLVQFWVNKPVIIPEKAEVLDWIHAFIETLIQDSGSYYVIFKLNGPTSQLVKQAVVHTKLGKQPEITLQRLFSNFVWRHNVQVTIADQIQTTYTENQLEEKRYHFCFYQLRYFSKKYLSPFSPFAGLKCRWKYTLLRDDYHQRWRIVRAIVIQAECHKPQD